VDLETGASTASVFEGPPGVELPRREGIEERDERP
jgi:hypothetical protein